MEFTDLPIPEPVMAGVRACGFVTCTPIQALALPTLLAGRDVAGQAQTGTGKTAAFLVALYTRLLAASPPDGAPPRQPGRPRALIIAPTRELVVQVERDARALGAHTGFTIAAVYGGVDYDKQKSILAAQNVDLLIGTPGRLIDFFKQKLYGVKEVEVLVIDEADRMFDMGFIADLRFLLRRLPPFDQRLSLLFSATLSYRAQELSYEYMNNPAMLAVESDVKTAAMVRQSLYHVDSDLKIPLLVSILRAELAEEGATGGGRVMIFINTKRMGERLKNWLEHNAINAGYLSGDVPQIKRLKVLQRFQDGELSVLIATDVAGRGLHIAGVTHVINFDLPENPEDYVHRIGRTARAGAAGDAISLVDEEGAYNLEAIETFIGMKIDVAWADEATLPALTRPPRSAVSARPARDGRERGGRGERGATSSGRGRSGGDRRATGPKPRSEREITAKPATPEGETTTATAPAVAAGSRRRRRRPTAGHWQAEVGSPGAGNATPTPGLADSVAGTSATPAQAGGDVAAGSPSPAKKRRRRRRAQRSDATTQAGMAPAHQVTPHDSPAGGVAES
ncbi:MAG: DEAD/DEAH box helicase [Magnetococcales bacterium]|nr:DEAD/DEAH box helicase [Magnetococcales bacterium]